MLWQLIIGFNFADCLLIFLGSKISDSDSQDEFINNAPYYDLSGVPGVKELDRTLEAISNPIELKIPIPVANVLFYKAYVSFNINIQKLYNHH